MSGFNELTKELLSQGYDENHFPENVKVAGGCLKKGEPLNNIYGGFMYLRYFSDDFIYRTGCGLFAKGKDCLTELCTMGITHSHENNNPVIMCPFRKSENCEKTFYCVGEWCECHRTEKPYDSEFCIQKEREKQSEHIHELYRQFIESRNGRACENHMRYDRKTDSVEFNYYPPNCINCCFHPDFCPILGKKLDTRKGNVFYDVKKIYPQKKRNGDNFSLLDKEFEVSIEKGKKYFSKPVSMDICKAFIKVCKGEIEQRWRLNNSSEWIFNPDFQFEIMNIRAEKKETRDIYQDIQDIKDGYTIIHESDKIQQKKDEKKERRENAKEQQKRKIIKKFKSGEELSLGEKRKIGKLFDSAEWAKIVREAKEIKKEPKEEQLTLF